MTFNEEFKKVIKEISELDINNDYEHEMLCKKELEIVTKDISSTINYLKTECTAAEFSWLSEIFEEIVEICPSQEFVDELYKLSEKYPEETKEYNIMSFIDEAARYLNEK